MIKDKTYYLLGGGWSSAMGYGVLGSKPQFPCDNWDFKYPDLQEIINELPSRFGRFDIYTKVCFSTAALALSDAGLLQREGKKNIGIVVGSTSGVYDNDLSFYESTFESNGSFSSPNLFSYTLPNVALGEIAVFFNFVGPTFCVGNDPMNPGLEGMPAALSLLEAGYCSYILVGWVEVARKTTNAQTLPKGAAFVVISNNANNTAKASFSFKDGMRFEELFEV